MTDKNSTGIRIQDLNAPVYSEMQQQVLAHMGQLLVTLTSAAVLAEAVEQTGLDDFGADDFKQRLDVWLQSVDEDTDLNNLGRYGIYNDCVRYASNRLKLEGLLKRHPEILDIEIKKPIIIAGLPRSGTTHLVNLIAADQRLRSMPYWESKEPIPIVGEALGPNGEDPRYIRCRQGWETQDAVLPLLKNMHAMNPDHIHEELEVENLDFSSYNLEWIARVPRWRDYYLAHDQTPHYEYIKKVLKALQWQRGPNRWILKSPQHMEQLVPLHKTFPDATIVITHRDPVSVITSTVTMLAYGDRMRRSRLDHNGLVEYWIDRIEKLLRSCVRDRDSLPAAQSLDVLFHEFMADDVATVERIYDLAGLPMTADASQSLNDYMAANPRGKHGQIIYDLQADFGFDPDEVRKRFAFYFERFPVQI
ncbi:MAG: sulfotransferase family protein [Pseudomonadales bacterium]